MSVILYVFIGLFAGIAWFSLAFVWFLCKVLDQLDADRVRPR